MAACNTQQNYDKISELKAFDDTKAGVKGLIDGGITKVPQIFIHPEALEKETTNPKNTHFIFPLIDLQNININNKEIVKQIQEASETWGFFQVINHGIPVPVLDEMLRGARRFHEQDIDVKKPYYSRDVARKVMYNCNFDLFSEKSLAANWRDSLYSVMAPNPANPEEIPETCREITIEYSNYVMNLGYTLLELFSQGLGLKPNHLKEMGCAEGLGILCNYYPKCPQPEVAIGTSRHADNDFFTVLLQDDIGGLQVFHKNQWVDVPPTHGALVVNIGDILQVAERALFLWNNNHVENLIKQNRKVILPIIFPALEKNARGHWNQAVQNLTLNVRKIFSDIDSELFEECLQKFEEDKAQEEEVKRKREITWKRLEELAGMKAASNEPVLVSHKTTPHSPSG